MTVLTTLLVVEYRYFKQQAERIEVLKQEYAHYIQSCKLVLEDYTSRYQSYLDDGQKKKSQTVTEWPYSSGSDCSESFIVVNRTPSYIRTSALDYARSHELGKAIERMYDMHDWLDDPTEQLHEQVQPVRRVGNKTAQKKSVAPMTHFKRDYALYWPLDKSHYWLSSTYGPRKKPDGSLGFHYGLDMAALKGTPVKAANSGTVVEASSSPTGYGKCIVIAHNKKYKTRYAHLDKMLVTAGKKVVKGEVIGLVGDTGSVRGKNASHLHFEVLVFGKQINPLHVLVK